MPRPERPRNRLVDQSPKRHPEIRKLKPETAVNKSQVCAKEGEDEEHIHGGMVGAERGQERALCWHKEVKGGQFWEDKGVVSGQMVGAEQGKEGVLRQHQEALSKMRA